MRSGSGQGWFGWAEAAVTGLALAAAAAWLLDEHTEAALFGLAFLGMVAGRALGIPRRALLLLVVTTAALITVALLGGFGYSLLTSTLSHVLISALLAWALSEPVWSRLPADAEIGGPRSLLTLVAVVLALGVCWEIGERIAETLLETGLPIRFIDTALDLVVDGLGAVAGALAAARLSERRASPRLGRRGPRSGATDGVPRLWSGPRSSTVPSSHHRKTRSAQGGPRNG